MATKLIFLPPDLDPPGFRETEPRPQGIKGMLGDLFEARLKHSRDRLESLWKTVVLQVPMDGPPAPEERSKPSYLPAVGAIIADDRDFDAEGVLAQGGAVVDNDPIDFAPPEAVVPDAAQMHWHQQSARVAVPWARGIRGQGTWIGVLDTGIDASHPEFAGKHIASAGTGCFAEFDWNGNRVNQVPRDAGDHGTHVCGIAAGSTRGIAPAAELAVAAVLTYRIGGGLQGYLAQIAAGINWLATTPFPGADPPGVDVINASIGALGYVGGLHSTIDAVRRVSGVQVIACIGNDGTSLPPNHWSPGNYNHVLGIGSTDAIDTLDVRSSWGRVANHGGIMKPDMCAPGHRVDSSLPNGRYARKSGTSMASPCVAGACALAIQAYPANLRRRPVALCEKMISLVRPAISPPNGNLGGAGTLDLTNL